METAFQKTYPTNTDVEGGVMIHGKEKRMKGKEMIASQEGDPLYVGFAIANFPKSIFSCFLAIVSDVRANLKPHQHFNISMKGNVKESV